MVDSDTRSDEVADDRATIERIVNVFFAAFTSGPELQARLDGLRHLFLPQAVIVRTCGEVPAVYDVEDFIEPRRRLLSSGDLAEFTEWELSGRTEVFGDIAQHFCSYAKRGVHAGKQFEARGMKALQLVRMPDGWRISAVAWDDERDGVTVPVAP